MVLTPKHQFGRYFEVAKLRKENYSGHHLIGVAPRDGHVPLRPNPAPSTPNALNTPNSEASAKPLVSFQSGLAPQALGNTMVCKPWH